MESTEETIKKLKQRVEENRQKAEKSENEPEAWFEGVAAGYEGALEVLRDNAEE